MRLSAGSRQVLVGFRWFSQFSAVLGRVLGRFSAGAWQEHWLVLGRSLAGFWVSVLVRRYWAVVGLIVLWQVSGRFSAGCRPHVLCCGFSAC